MKPATLKTFNGVHTWTGLAAGMALFIAFYTGAITVFMHDLESWDAYTGPETVAAEQTYVDAQRLVDRVLEMDPEAGKALRLYPAKPEHPENSAIWYERLADGTYETHQYRLADGGELNTALDTAHLASFIYRLHYTAGLPYSPGLQVLGIICLIYGLALITGMVIFLPNFLKDLFVIRAGANRKRFWLDTHNVVGVISLPWHFMFAWSSALLAIGIYFLVPFQYLFGETFMASVERELGFVSTLDPADQPAPMISVPRIMDIAEREAPGIEPRQIRYANAGDVNGTVTVYGDVAAGSLAPYATVVLSSATGEVLYAERPQSATAGSTLYNGLISLHYVSFGGYTAKWVYFLLGLAGAYLFYSGNLLWVESRRKRRQAEQRSTTRFLARLNSGVCIGCMAGVSAAFLASRGLSGFADRADLTELAYYGVFFLAIVWCFVRPVAQGARDLLYLCTALTALIPVFDAIVVDMPIWRSALTGGWALFTVDALAILAAVAFWRMARAVQARAREGDPNSVWAFRSSRTEPAPEPDRYDASQSQVQLRG